VTLHMPGNASLPKQRVIEEVMLSAS
jgi:hypothetical protein